MINWVKIARTNPIIYNISNYFLKGWCKDDLIWKSNLMASDIPTLGIENCFWEKVLIYWCELNYHIPQSMHEVENQVIWLNSHVKIENKIIIPQHAQICYVKDICTDVGLSTLALTDTMKPESMNWLKYQVIWKAIPTPWKNLLTEHTNGKSKPTI